MANVKDPWGVVSISEAKAFESKKDPWSVVSTSPSGSGGQPSQAPQKTIQTTPPPVMKQAATVSAWTPTATQKARIWFDSTRTGRTLENSFSQIRQMAGNVWEKANNPFGGTNEEWEGLRKRQNDFVDRYVPAAIDAAHVLYGTPNGKVAKGVVQGGIKGVIENAENMTSPTQIALMAGTFGSTGLVNAARSANLPKLVPVARTLGTLIQAEFVSQMGEGAYKGIKNAANSVKKGDWESASENAVGGMISLLMAHQGMKHAIASDRVHADLNKEARSSHGVPFDRLSPEDQGVVIDHTVRNSKAYSDIFSRFQESSEKGAESISRKKKANLARYSNIAWSQAWKPEASHRAAELFRKEESDRAVAAEKSRAEAEIVRQARQRAQEIREGRTARKSKTAQEKSAMRNTAREISEQRAQVLDQRKSFEKAATPSEGTIPQREVNVETDPASEHVSYVGNDGDVSARYGVAEQDGQIYVYRMIDRDGQETAEWMDSYGRFNSQPESLFEAPDADTADALAKIGAARLDSEGISREDKATEKQKSDPQNLLDISLRLSGGEIDPSTALKMAGIGEDPKIPSSFDAAKNGQLTGPLYGTTHSDYVESFREALRDAGSDDAEVSGIMDNVRELVVSQTEGNLNHLGKSGDFIISKRGTKWTLDGKGILRPENGKGAPVPLMKNGRYSSQAVQIASSGRIGYGSESVESRADRILWEEKAKKAAEDADNIILSFDNGSSEEKASRREAWMRGHRPVAEKAGIDESGEAVGKIPEVEPALANLLLSLEDDPFTHNPQESIAVYAEAANGAKVPIEELARHKVMASGTPEQKAVARLQPGDEIIQGRRTWIVSSHPDKSKLYIDTMGGNRAEIDRLNPGKFIRSLVKTGEKVVYHGEPVAVKDVPEPAYVYDRKNKVDIVNDIASGKVIPPEPESKKEAKAETMAADDRSMAAVAEATEAALKMSEPDFKATEEDINKAAASSQEAMRVAKNAGAQRARAAGIAARIETKDAKMVQLAPITRGLRGKSVDVTQGDSVVPSHYEAVRLHDLIRSHSWQGNSLVKNEKYTPEQMQKRDFDSADTEANFQRASLDNYRLGDYLQDYNGPERGPSIVEPGGRVVGGNTRLLIMEKYLENIAMASNEDTRRVAIAVFNDEMRRFAAQVGVPGFPVDGEPMVVVRMLDRPIDSVEEAVRLGNLFNERTSVEVAKNVEAVTHGKFLVEADANGDDVMKNIASKIAEENSQTVRAAIDSNPRYFADVAKKYFHIPDTENKEWFENSDQGLILSKEGKDRFELALISTHVRNIEAVKKIAGTTPGNSLGSAIGPLAALRAYPERDITTKISDAVEALALTEKYRRYSPDGTPGDKPGVAWAKAYGIDTLAGLGLETPTEPDLITHAIYQAMLDRKTTRLKVAIKDLIGAERPGEMMLIAPEVEGKALHTPADYFNAAFEPELKEIARQEQRPYREITQAEFEEAITGKMIETPDAPEEKHVAKEELKTEEVAPKTEEKKVAPPPEAKIEEKRIPPPPETTSKKDVADRAISEAKQADGWVTPKQLKDFLSTNPATADHAPELYRTAQLLAEYVYEVDPPEGVEKRDALAWVMKERLAKIEAGQMRSKRGEYTDPNLERSLGEKIMRLHKAATPDTFIHEFAHVVFPMLSDEDIKAVSTIRGQRGEPRWDGNPTTMTKEIYRSVSEKFAHGLEQFLRDENPADFTSNVKAVLKKVKEIMKRTYLAFRNDPLSEYKNTEASREFFSKVFGITGFDKADEWREVVKRERAKEAEPKAKGEKSHPVEKIAKETGATSLGESVNGTVEDSVGDRIDPRKPTAAMTYNTQEEAVTAFSAMGTESSPIKSAELIKTSDDKWAIKVNTESRLPSGSLYQDLPQRHIGLQLEDLEKRLRSTPDFKILERKLLETRISVLKKKAREAAGIASEEVAHEPDLASRVLEEKRNAPSNAVRKGAHGLPGNKESERAGRIPQPPKLGMPGHAAAAAKPRGAAGRSLARVPTSLDAVRPVSLEPLPERKPAVGLYPGSTFDEAAWKSELAESGLPDNVPAPTVLLDPFVSEKLIYPGQKQIVQTALSALDQGDGFAAFTPPGSGKTFVATGTIREFDRLNPNSKILYISKNRKLLNKTQKVAAETFGYDMDLKQKNIGSEPGVWGVSFSSLLQNSDYKKVAWDLVVVDESGEARNWYKEGNQQGKALIDVVNSSRKAMYMSATPFHTPMEYGYAEKLGLWKPGQFSSWIADNFAHEKLGDKVIARIDPAKQAKLRQQLIERGQMISQAISYDGFNAHLGVVPVTTHMLYGLDQINEGFNRARNQLLRMGKKGAATNLAAFEATYTKAFLEREMLEPNMELAKKAREQGWQVILVSETSSEDLFRREREQGVEPSAYQELDDEMGGQLSKILPPFSNVFDTLKDKFGEEIVDYSGRGNTFAEREKGLNDFLSGKSPMIYTTYAAGGIGVDMHDTDYPDNPNGPVVGGDKPRVLISLGVPYSGVLLEQMMGRPWRFGVKSDVHAVILATDSDPDVRLLQQKVAPRMRGIRASVDGVNDSFAQAMSDYTDEEKVRARQDMMAYAEGNEEKVDVNRYYKRSKGRKVGIQDWSSIEFPPAETAKNKGMKYSNGAEKGGWNKLYQDKEEGWITPPPTPEDKKVKDGIDEVANRAAKNPNIPRQVISQSADRAEGIASAAPEGVDKKAAAQSSVEASLNAHGYFQDPDTGAWEMPHGLAESMMSRDVNALEDHDIKNYTIPTLGMNLEQRLLAIGRKYGFEGQVRSVVNMVRGYYQETSGIRGPLQMRLLDAHRLSGLDLHDKAVMQKVWDVKEGKISSDDPRVNKAVAMITDITDEAHRMMSGANVPFRRDDGSVGTYKDIAKNPIYMPHITDWKMKLTDPDTGETKTLREIVGDKGIDEAKAVRFFEAERRRLGATEMDARRWLYDLKRDRSASLRGPHNPNITERRKMNHPFYHKDIWALNSYIDQVASAVALEKEFGTNMSKLQQAIAKVPSRKLRTDMLESISTIFERQSWDSGAARLIRAGQGFEALTKMTLSPLSVIYHGIHTTIGLQGKMKYLPSSIVKSLIHPIKFRREAYFAGVASARQNPWLLEGGYGGLSGEYFRVSGFNSLYLWMRSIVGETAKEYLQQASIGELKKGGASAESARRILKDRFLIGDKAIDDAIATGKWDDDSVSRARRAFSDFVTFSENPLQMPRLARMHIDPNMSLADQNLRAAARGMYTLQSFSIKTYSLMRETVYDEIVKHGNLRPLIPLLTLYPAAGIALGGSKAFVKAGFQRATEKIEKKDHQKDALDKWFEQFSDVKKHPWVAPAKIYIDSICTAAALESTKRWMDLVMSSLEGKRVQLKYAVEDELEQKVGAIYSDIAKTVLAQAEAVDNYRKTKSPKKSVKGLERDESRALEDVLPISRVIPNVDRAAHQKKKKGFQMAH